MELPIEDKKKFTGILLLLGLVLTLFVFMKFVAEIKGLKAVGGAPVYNTISIVGEGEAFAVSDMATISFTVRVDEKLVSDAQAKVNEQVSGAISKIEDLGISKDDIKTVGYYTTPKYDYSYDVWPRPVNPKITGYEVSQTTEVKIKDVALADDVADILATLEVTEVSGPNFGVLDEDSIKEEARILAIKDSREEAEKMADALGVRIVKVIGFWEENNNYYGESYAMDAAVSMVKSSAEFNPGENKTTSRVTVIYEIR
ncbi:MAG: SIMPL domain-containing protein [Candidatus Pacebacteria bacterium]|jgi:uncharacterized protein YggE|nr:SIMPL domain-containing protein [Candidatus Paceibacterota bacterium]MBP9058277.1 SIMPL domain-containing protein [Candidatus Paceibacterota bacterium]